MIFSRMEGEVTDIRVALSWEVREVIRYDEYDYHIFDN